MIIEFVGLSGAGKSTIARNLAETKGFRIVKIRKKSELIYYNLKFLMTCPIKFFRLFVLVVINSRSMKEFYYKFMNCFLDYNAKYQKARNYKLALLDQGYFQNIASLFSEELRLGDLKEYKRYILLPDKLFIFNTNINERSRRHEERGYETRSNFSDLENDNYKNISEKNFDLFLDKHEEIFMPSIMVDSNENSEKVTMTIANLL